MSGSGAAPGPAKMKIKPFVRPPSLPADFEDSSWAKLEEAVDAILHMRGMSASSSSASSTALSSSSFISSSQPPPTVDPHLQSRESLYRLVEDLCVHKFAPNLYRRLEAKLDAHVGDVLSKLRRAFPRKESSSSSSSSSEGGAVAALGVGAGVSGVGAGSYSASEAQAFLQALDDKWSELLTSLKSLRQVFLYLDRSYVLHQAQALTTVYDTGLALFKKHFLSPSSSSSSSDLCSQTVSASLSLLSLLLSGESVPTALLRGALRTLAALGLYGQRFNGPFAEHVRRHFAMEGTRLIRQVGVSGFGGLSSSSSSSDAAAATTSYQSSSSSSSSASASASSFSHLSSSPSTSTPSAGSSLATYLHHVSSRFAWSSEALQTYLDPSSRPCLLSALDDGLVVPHVPQLLGAGFDDLLLQCRAEDLKDLYGIVKRVGMVDKLKHATGRVVRAAVEAIASAASGVPAPSQSDKGRSAAAAAAAMRRASSEPAGSGRGEASKDGGDDVGMAEKNVVLCQSMVPPLLALRSSLGVVLSLSFSKDEQLVGSVKDAFEAGLNCKGFKSAEALAKFVDATLRSSDGGRAALLERSASQEEEGAARLYEACDYARGQRTLEGGRGGVPEEDESAEGTLERVMVLFRYLNGKDVFEAFYRKDLSKRLLTSASSSMDLERHFVTALKTECGTGYTAKVEGMFKDMVLAREIRENYNEHFRDKFGDGAGPGQPNCAMDINVLTTGYWPTYPAMDKIKLPSTLSVHVKRFEQYYVKKYQGRRLVWQHMLSSCTVKANFPLGAKTLQVSQLQAMVLLCFNDGKDDLTARNIYDVTGIEMEELKRTLQSLSLGLKNTRVLKKSTKEKEVRSSDTFAFNRQFTNPKLKVKISSVHLKETVEENDKTHEAVLQDRMQQIDAAIVRTLKARKTMSHLQLTTELMTQLKFPAATNDIKNRISSLIEREYMERDEKSPNQYNYVA